MHIVKKTAGVLIVSLAIAVISAVSVNAAEKPASKESRKETPKRMVLSTPDGREVLLKEDNTWEPEGGREMIVDKDFTVPLPDGRFVLINADGSWGFVTKEVQYAEDMLTVDMVAARGTGKSIDVNAATAAARKQALDNAVIKTRDAARGIKIKTAKLRECIEQVEKDEESEESFVNGKGWSVNVILTLDKGSLLAVIDCARDTSSVKTGK